VITRFALDRQLPQAIDHRLVQVRAAPEQDLIFVRRSARYRRSAIPIGMAWVKAP